MAAKKAEAPAAKKTIVVKQVASAARPRAPFLVAVRRSPPHAPFQKRGRHRKVGLAAAWRRLVLLPVARGD